jgi:VWFA-related protein
MRVSPKALVLAIPALVVAAGYRAWAQDQNQPPQPRPFQAEVNYVRVDMYPTLDRKPVTDLLASEVELLEDGVPQKIEQFEHVFLGGPRPSSRPEPSTLNEMRRATQDPRARVFVLFLDPRHVDVQGSLRVRKPMIDALNALVGGDDLIAVMTPEMTARSLTFTRRVGNIEQMLTPHWGQANWIGTKDPVEVRYDACYNTPRIIDGPAIYAEMIARRREKLVLDTVEDLVQYLRGLREERKAVITISDGWPLYGPDRNLAKPLLSPPSQPGEPPGNVNIEVPKPGRDPVTGRPSFRDPTSVTISSDGIGTVDRAACEVDRNALAEINHEQRFTSLMQAANRANVSFYPIGPSGFSGAAAPLDARRRSVEMMADITDGLAIFQPISLETGLRRMVDDLSSYYLAGYYSNAKPDGRFHRITVRVKRPGVQVRARAGYLAATPAEATSSRTSPTVSSPDVAEGQLVARALTPLAALGRERPVRVQAAAVWTAAGAAVVRAVAEVPQGNVRGDDWGKGGQLDATLRDELGGIVASGRAELTPGSYVAQIALTSNVPLTPGDYDLQVRAKGVAVISPGIDSVRVTISAAPSGDGAVFMRRGPTTGNREVVTADARFRRAERIILELPASSSSDVSGRLLDRTGKPLNVPVTATIRQDADGVRWRRVEIMLAPLAPADYIIESSAGQERTLTGFRVVP